MTFIKTCVRTLLTIAQKGAYCLSYVWFLLPIISLYVFKEICCNMDDNPAKTDFYLNTYLLIFLIFIIAIVALKFRGKNTQFAIASGVAFYMILAFGFLGLFLASAPTGFAEQYPIPEGLEYHTPLKSHNTPDVYDDEVEKYVCQTDTTTYLQIRNGIQGGNYEYSFFYPMLPEGTIYLRCYEATTNLPLSEKRIKKSSSQQIPGSTRFSCHVRGKKFTIYEGDWGKYYAARIEVWFKGTNGDEKKLAEKIYAVEGWMR